MRDLTMGTMKPLLLAALLSAAALPAAQTNTSAAAVGGRFLNLPGGARSVAMGGALGADNGSLDGLGANPAGLAGLRGLQASFTHSLWIEDSSLDHLSAGYSPRPGMGLAATLDYFNEGSVDAYSLDGGGFPQPAGTLHPFALSAGLSYGQSLGAGWQAGLSVKALDEDLGAAASAGVAADLGLRWAAPVAGLSLGVAAVNLGTPLAGAPLPASARLALAYDLEPAMHFDARVTGDVLWAVQDQTRPQMLAGLELAPVASLTLRAGYRAADEDTRSGAAFGLGLRLGWARLDYAYDLAGALGATQQFTLSAALPSALPKPQAQPTLQPTPAPAAPQPGPLEAVAMASAAPPSTPQVQAESLLQAIQTHDDAKVEAATQAVLAQGPALVSQVSMEVKEQRLAPAVFNGELSEAESAARALTRLEPTNALGFQALGIILWHEGDQAGCIENLRKALALEPSRTYLTTFLRWAGAD